MNLIKNIIIYNLILLSGNSWAMRYGVGCFPEMTPEDYIWKPIATNAIEAYDQRISDSKKVAPTIPEKFQDLVLVCLEYKTIEWGNQIIYSTSFLYENDEFPLLKLLKGRVNTADQSIELVNTYRPNIFESLKKTLDTIFPEENILYGIRYDNFIQNDQLFLSNLKQCLNVSLLSELDKKSSLNIDLNQEIGTEISFVELNYKTNGLSESNGIVPIVSPATSEKELLNYSLKGKSPYIMWIKRLLE